MGTKVTIDRLESDELGTSLRTLTVIWGAYLVSVLIYAFVVPRLIGPEILSFVPRELHRTVRVVLYVGSGALIFLARFLWKRTLARTTAPSTRTAVSRHPAVQRYSTAMILALGCSEAVAICGLALFLMAGDRASLYLLGAASLLSMQLYRPSRHDILDVARHLELASRSGGAVTRG